MTAGARLPDGTGRAGPGAGPPGFMAAFSRLSRTHNTQMPLQDDENRGCPAHCGYLGVTAPFLALRDSYD